MKILLIDDEPHIIRALSFLLKRAGYEVAEAHNGAQGLQRLRDDSPDIVICDVMMPQLTGLDVLAAWRNERADADTVPFILLTASVDLEIEAVVQSSANVQLIRKPFSPNSILQVVQTLEVNRSAANPSTDLGG